jgi:hypothetical protein
MAMFAVSMAEPAFSQTANVPTPIVRDSMTLQSQFSEFKTSMKKLNVNVDYIIVKDVNTDLSTFTKSKLNGMPNSGNNSMMIVIATDRTNRIGTKPSIRIEGNGFHLSNDNIESILTLSYYPALEKSGFDTAFPILLNQIRNQAEIVAPDPLTVTVPNNSTTYSENNHKSSEPENGFLIFLPYFLGFGGLLGGGILLYKFLVTDKSKKSTGYKPSYQRTAKSYGKSNPSNNRYGKSSSYIGTDSGIDEGESPDVEF